MAEKKENKGSKPSASPKNEGTAQQDGGMPRVAINAQYIKDVSFENPKAPGSLFMQPKPGTSPKVDVSVDLKASALNKEKGLFEVELNISAKTEVEGEVAFIAELSYAAAVTLINVQERDLEGTLLVYCPSMLFPYARRILSDLTRDGGFTPLMLDPIDFASLYMQRKQQGKPQTANA